MGAERGGQKSTQLGFVFYEKQKRTGSRHSAFPLIRQVGRQGHDRGTFQWQGELESRATPLPGLHPDSAPVRSDNAPADREPKPGTSGVIGAWSAMKLLEDGFLHADRYSCTAVGDLHDYRTIISPGGNGDRCLRRRMLRRVFEEVNEYLLDQEFIDRDQRQVMGKLGPDRVRSKPVLKPEERHTKRFFERLPGLLYGEPASLHPDHVQQVGYKPGHPSRFLQHGICEFPSNLGR
jgi:hypothetical protein